MHRIGRLLIALTTLAFLGIGLTWVLLERRPTPTLKRIHLMTLPDPVDSQVQQAHRDGLVLLVQDLLEVEGRFLVSLDENQAERPTNVPILALAPLRRGMMMRLDLQWYPGSPQPYGLPSTEAFAEPKDLIRALLTSLGLQPRNLDAFLPRTAPAFWDLLECLGHRSDAQLERNLDLGHKLLVSDPQVAAVHVTLATASFRKLALDQQLDPSIQARTEKLFRRALELIPHYPRAAYRFAILLTDSGKQREALDLLLEAHAHRPHAAHLLSALAYTGRTAGLLEGALRALDLRDRQLGHQRFTADFVENTYLYAGQWDRFEADLGTGEGETGLTTLRDFYRGYLRLVRQRPDEARAYFARATSQQASVTFQALAGVFLHQLEGRPAKARTAIERLKQDRSRLRAPDGEFTFKLAEAYAFLGQLDQAEDLAARAASQGFGCTQWYRESPFLKPLLERRRYQALLQNLGSRQQLLERRFPTGRFG